VSTAFFGFAVVAREDCFPVCLIVLSAPVFPLFFDSGCLRLAMHILVVGPELVVECMGSQNFI